jgi:hypothetical protein
MRAPRHLMMRRLRVLLAWAVVVWGAGMAAPPLRVDETAFYASRIASAQRVVRARLAEKAAALPRIDVPPPPVAQPPQIDAVERGERRRIYLLHQSLLL